MIHSYVIALGRAPEPEGETFWVNQIESGAMTRVGVLRAILASPEFAAWSQIDALKSNDHYVEILYASLLGRFAEPEGKAYWIAALERGMTRPEVAIAFTFTPEFSDMERNPSAVCLFE